MVAMLREAGHQEVRMLAFDSKRYVGAQIGIHGPTGEKVGTVSRLRNVEYLFVAGPTERVEAAVPAEGALPELLPRPATMAP
jgi:adenine-specific DNA-methyltransferase